MKCQRMEDKADEADWRLLAPKIRPILRSPANCFMGNKNPGKRLWQNTGWRGQSMSAVIHRFAGDDTGDANHPNKRRPA
jgi:hypothetical protein